MAMGLAHCSVPYKVALREKLVAKSKDVRLNEDTMKIQESEVKGYIRFIHIFIYIINMYRSVHMFIYLSAYIFTCLSNYISI